MENLVGTFDRTVGSFAGSWKTTMLNILMQIIMVMMAMKMAMMAMKMAMKMKMTMILPRVDSPDNDISLFVNLGRRQYLKDLP